jgi:predicted nucleic acid-binding protein
VTAYVDSSIILRLALRQPNALPDWRRVRRGVSSALIHTECLRSLDRLRLAMVFSDTDMAERRTTILALIDSLELVQLDMPILNRAAQPMPTSLGTLDAIHLSTALLWQEIEETPLTFATHDEALARAARAHGLLCIGAQ